MHCRSTRWDSTAFHLITYLLSLFHTDRHTARSSIQQHRRWRSTAFIKHVASEHSETQLLSISPLIDHLHFIQTLTKLNLQSNKIGSGGAQYLASAVHVNRVRLDISSSHHSSILFVSHRHSQRCIFHITTSVLKEHGIYHVYCKWTESDLTSLHPNTDSLSWFHTDSHNAGSSRERYWCWRSSAVSKCIASEHSQTQLLSISALIYLLHFTQTLTTLDLGNNNISAVGTQHLTSALPANTVRRDFSTSQHSSTVLTSHRHSQRCILIGTISALKEHSIWQMHCKRTEWESTFLHLITYHFIQTLTTLSLERNNIGAIGTRHLADALQVNTVRLDLSASQHWSAIFISHRYSQR